MNYYQGNIFKGTFDTNNETFYLREVKHLETQSNLSETNLNQLYNHLLRHREEDSYTITVNDQIPLLLSNEEIQQLLDDLSQIMKKL